MRRSYEEREAEQKALVERLYQHIEHLSVRIGERHLWRDTSLDQSAEYIESVLTSLKYPVWRQTYPCYGKSVSNLIAEKPGAGEGLVILGAHYDTVPGTPGADDNASAVAGLLELARLCQGMTYEKTLAFAAFANEEPPCFGSANMGSMVYARHLRSKGTRVVVMICLEMIGYFTEKRIQNYPLPGMGLFYPREADYIGVVGNFRSRRYVTLVKRGIRKHSSLNARSLTGPEFFGGINLSDHSSFWRHGYQGIMVTDTSFFRNRHYHQATDSIETLDFERMGEVVRGLFHTLSQIR